MKRNYWIMLLAAALLLTACGGTSQPEALPTVVLESSTGGTNAPTTTSGGTVVASAEIRPAEAVDLSFPLLGAVKIAHRGAQNHNLSRDEIEERYKGAFGFNPWR